MKMADLRIFAFADEASPQIDRQIAAMKRNGLQGLEIRNVDGETPWKRPGRFGKNWTTPG